MNTHFPFCLLLCGIAFLAILSSCAAKPQSLPDVSSASDSETLQEASRRTFPMSRTWRFLRSCRYRQGSSRSRFWEGETGTIHYSYYLPHGYNERQEYPLMMVMPGYDMMWFGEESSGSNLNWRGFYAGQNFQKI